MRDLRREDLPSLERILVATAAFTPVEVECAVELLMIVLDQPEQRDYHVVVAEANGNVAGYALYGPVPLTHGTFDLYWIATDPELHGQGFGRRLMEEVERRLRTGGGRLLCLETSSQGGYSRTRSFYEAAGYKEECRIRDFYHAGDDRITYVKRL
ncbi:MAG TPA: GNAT family N-acetyltransferase [Geobacterales bacterium]|nr:GNAT family N-acetyltransferase [Geobacterales bacterium]